MISGEDSAERLMHGEGLKSETPSLLLWVARALHPHFLQGSHFQEAFQRKSLFPHNPSTYLLETVQNRDVEQTPLHSSLTNAFWWRYCFYR